MKLKKSFLSTLLALSLAGTIGFTAVTQTACSRPNNNDTYNEQSETTYYKLTLNLNGGELPAGQNFKQFEADKIFILPIPTMSGHKFGGWYDNAEFAGNAYTQIDKVNASADKEFWAKWTAEDSSAPNTYSVTLHLNEGNFKEGYGNITSYISGTTVTLPKVERYGYEFEGWYESIGFSGSPVTEISATATGSKQYYAKWTKTDDGSDVKPDKLTVTFDYNYVGAIPPTKTEVEYGKMVEPANPTRIGYDFLGWFEKDSSTEYNFSAGTIENIALYAHWKVQTYNVVLIFNDGTIVNGNNITSYTYGECVILPELERSGHTFAGWYESVTFEGNEVTEISKTATGDKTYYAKWEAVEVNALNVTSVGGYEEGAYIELDRITATNVADYTISYKPSSSGVAAYTAIDAELVRNNGASIRADFVGLPAGNYDIKVEVNNFAVEKANILVSAYDRSGYAHFNYNKGVGAYNDNGTLKEGAIVVYVTEETKNTVKATLNGSTYTGIADILTHSSRLGGKTPLVVRIIGTIGAATWNEIDYSSYLVNGQLPNASVKGINGKQLPTDHKDITQKELIEGGYNTLNTTEYSELKGLTSKATYKDGEYDSAWNNCSIDSASNVTVEGIGADARLFQWGLTWRYGNSIEVRNLTFEDYTEDACSFEGGTNSTTMDGFDSNNIWVHHNTFLEGKNYWDVSPDQDKREGDGATDFKKNAYITMSYNHYVENRKTGLIGGGDDQTTACVTFHHNWYEKCSSRLPLGREANMHMYNNFYDGSTRTNMSLRAGAYALIENCYFKNANNPITTEEGYNPDNSKIIKGVAKVVNCVFYGCSIGSAYINNGTVYNYSSNTSNRATTVANYNVFDKNFDTNPEVFYYDAINNKSLVKLDGKNNVPEIVMAQSGVHK